MTDASFVPLRAPVASVELDGEVVLAGGTETFYWLEPLASIAWSCFDGSGTVEEIAADLAAEYDTEHETVQRDVLRLAHVLAQLGFLQGSELRTELAAGPVHEPSDDVSPQPRFLVDPPSS